MLAGTGIWLAAAAAALAAGEVVPEKRPVDSSRVSITGSAACQECHPAFHNLWEHSRHGASVVPVTDVWAERELGVLPAEVRGGAGEVYRLGRAERGLEVAVEGKVGEKVPVAFALGGRDLWYLLGELEDERLQVLPVAFDRHRVEWFNPASSAVRPHSGEGESAVDWRSPAYTFSQGCYACHVSGGGEEERVSATRTTRWWDEPGIRCESCHGPGAEHVRVCREASEGEPPSDLKITAVGRFTAAQLDGLCGSCHAKRVALTPGLRPGDLLVDHYDLALLEDPDFAVDGRSRGETYTMTSWLANACAERGGLDCLHCHTSSGRNRFPGAAANQACLPCHEELVSKVETHSRHAVGEPGGQCADCHLPVSEFARMRRHDHSFRPPAPAASVEFGGSNACNDCHQDQDAVWAAEQVREWHGDDSQALVVERARWIDRARRRDWSDLGGMLASLDAAAREPVYVASLIRLLGACEDERKVPALVRALSHPSPWVQASAALGLEGRLTPAAVAGLAELAGHDRLLVRLRAAQALAPLPDGVLEGAEQAQVNRAMGELEGWLRSRSADPLGMEALAHFRLDRGDAGEGARWFDRALESDPARLALLISAGTAHYRAGDPDRAGERFRTAVKAHPESRTAWSNWVRYLEWTGREDQAAAARGEALARFGTGDAVESLR